MKTTAPNIKDVSISHQECLTKANPRGQDTRFIEGDVRRCPHGKVQICHQPANSNLVGPGTYRWGDLSRFWDRKTYKLASAALENSAA